MLNEFPSGRWNAPYTCIYCLRDPQTMRVRYIGCSTNPARRYFGYLYGSAAKKQRPLDAWIKSLKSHGLRPVMNVWQIVPSEIATVVEHSYIESYAEFYDDLLNGHAKHQPISNGYGVEEMRLRPLIGRWQALRLLRAEPLG